MILKKGFKVDALEVYKFISSEDIINRLKEMSDDLMIPESDYEYIVDHYFDVEKTKDGLELTTLKENLTENDLYSLVEEQSSGYYHLFYVDLSSKYPILELKNYQTSQYEQYKKDANSLSNYVLKHDVEIDDSLKNEWTEYLKWEKQMITKEQLIQEIEKQTQNYTNQWNKGVLEYAKEMLEELDENGIIDFSKKFTNKELFNGASTPEQYSNSGNTLISNYDIANRLYPPSVAKNMINKNLLDIQTMAISQAKGWIEVAQDTLLAKRSNAYDLSKISEAKSEVKSILGSSNNQTQTKTNNR